MALVGHTHVIEEHLVSVRFFVGIYIMPHKHLCEPFLSLESYRSIHLFHISKCDVFAYSKYNNNCRLVIEKVYFSPQPSTCQRDLCLANFNLNNLSCSFQEITQKEVGKAIFPILPICLGKLSIIFNMFLHFHRSPPFSAQRVICGNCSLCSQAP